jgi:hypothetical protein
VFREAATGSDDLVPGSRCGRIAPLLPARPERRHRFPGGKPIDDRVGRRPSASRRDVEAAGPGDGRSRAAHGCAGSGDRTARPVLGDATGTHGGVGARPRWLRRVCCRCSRHGRAEWSRRMRCSTPAVPAGLPDDIIAALSPHVGRRTAAEFARLVGQDEEIKGVLGTRRSLRRSDTCTDPARGCLPVSQAAASVQRVRVDG